MDFFFLCEGAAAAALMQIKPDAISCPKCWFCLQPSAERKPHFDILLLTHACTATEPQRTRIGRGLLRGFLSRSSGYEQYMACYGGFCLCFPLMLRFGAFSLLSDDFFQNLLLARVRIRLFLKHMHRAIAHFWPVYWYLAKCDRSRRKKQRSLCHGIKWIKLTQCTTPEVGKICCGLLK